MKMFVQKLQHFVDHPLTQKIDLAAVATAGAYLVPDFRIWAHDWGIIASDLVPLGAILWFLVQIVCKITLTIHEIFWKGRENGEV